MKTDSATIKTGVIDTVKSQGPLVMLVVLCVIAGICFPAFATSLNLVNISRQISMFGLLALGMAFVILSGGIDLSVGSIAVVASIVALQAGRWFAPAAVVAPILVGVAIGAFNGALITWGGIPPFIATLAMMLGVKGLAFVLAGEGRSAAAAEQVVNVSGWFPVIFRGDCFGIPYPAIILIAALGVAVVVSKYTSFGRSVFAVGGSEEAARMMGLNVNKCKMLVYMICGGCAGAAGLLLASRLKAIDPTATGGWELTAIAAVVIGGIPLTGGLGKIGHVIYGVLILGIIPNLINHLRISLPPWYNEMITGMLLLAVVLLQSLIAKRGTR
ncbi:MAG: ABC transporter permease [Phycisphaerae bacterium]|nr:ABC transporter permease [Planctomycetota bacterium]MBL7221733.1 ABC transporter permease [Phycisphaerae bacterium]